MEQTIFVNGTLYDIGIPVIKFDDIGGFDGYTKKTVVLKEENRKTGVIETKTLKGYRFSKRAKDPISSLKKIKQIVVHHSGGDGKNPSGMYETLYMQRCLSVQFAVEDDGRIWQFNDVIDSCWHAGSFNPTSVGMELCLFPWYDDNPDYYSEKNRLRTGNLPHGVLPEIVNGRLKKAFQMPTVQVVAAAKLSAGIFHAINQELKKNNEQNLDFEKGIKFPRKSDKSFHYPNQPSRVFMDCKKHVGLLCHSNISKTKTDPNGLSLVQFEDECNKYYNDLSLLR